MIAIKDLWVVKLKNIHTALKKSNEYDGLLMTKQEAEAIIINDADYIMISLEDYHEELIMSYY